MAISTTLYNNQPTYFGGYTPNETHRITMYDQIYSFEIYDDEVNSLRIRMFDGNCWSDFHINRWTELQGGLTDGDLINFHRNRVMKDPSYRYFGPSNEELQRYPAMAEAWQEFLLVKKICTGRTSNS